MKSRKIRFVLELLVFFVIVFPGSFAYARILVVSPHPDDDLITAAGIIYRAARAGEPVKIVYMTNGDYTGGQSKGFTRQLQAVHAESRLGIPEDSLCFLGYPDGYLDTVYTTCPNAGDVCSNSWGQTTTYGKYGLGHADYHSYRFGVPATYNSYNILGDLADIISSYKPDHIFTLVEFDAHPDHSFTYRYVKQAVLTVLSEDTTYTPTIHKTVVWWSGPGTWPNPGDPERYFAEIQDLLAVTGYSWTNRESIDVPLLMQSVDYTVNPKALAIADQETEGGTQGFLGPYIHKDEFFWTENPAGGNRPPIPDAGTDQIGAAGSMVYLNGTGSHDPDGQGLFFRWTQTSGTEVPLLNSTGSIASFTAPAGMNQDEILTFELLISDGTFTSVPDSVLVKASAAVTSFNIAPSAAVTASSETAQYGQLAVKAVDGVVDGYPGDYTKEWATNRQRTGAWLEFVWPTASTVDRVVLYDRPNSADQILKGTLTFSDGSTLQVGPLANNGGATGYSFTPKVITSLRLTVDQVSSSSQNIGLAEIEVFGSQVSGAHYTVKGNIVPEAVGSIARNPDKATYSYGEQVTLTATAGAGYVFSAWTGDAGGSTQNPIVITMNSDKTVTANFIAAAGVLSVTPSDGLNASGPAGGPFSPSSRTYSLQNTGTAAINWTASATQSWLSLSSISGSLESGATATLTVSLVTAETNSFAAGSYNDAVTFTNTTNGNGNTVRTVALSVQSASPVNIASVAVVTASSESPQYGQLAIKAVDGAIDGYPGDYTKEWATNGQGAGAWLQLNWTVPYTVDRVVLYDRPNSVDQITKGTLVFSDGSTLAVGPLTNSGAATEYTFTAKTITSLRLTVDQARSGTKNIGLSEIQVFGSAR